MDDKHAISVELAAMPHDDMWQIILTALNMRSFNVDIELKLLDPYAKGSDVLLMMGERIKSMRSRLPKPATPASEAEQQKGDA